MVLCVMYVVAYFSGLGLCWFAWCYLALLVVWLFCLTCYCAVSLWFDLSARRLRIVLWLVPCFCECCVITVSVSCG